MASAVTIVRTSDAILEVRPLAKADMARVVDYFLSASDADVERMGVDKSRLPSAKQWLPKLEAAVGVPAREAKGFYLGWRVDGQAVGFSSLKRIQYGERGEMHLHMWSPPHRGRGHGAVLFSLSALDFYARFQLKEIVCEPKADNPMPNRMLARVGFPLVKTYVGASSEISATATLNRYEIRRGIAESYLDAHAAGWRKARSGGHGPSG